MRNPKHDPAIDRVFIDANAHYFEQLIYSLGSDLDCVPPNPDRFHLRILAHSYGLNEFVKRIDEGFISTMSINWEKVEAKVFLNIRGTQREFTVEALKPIKHVIDESVEKTKMRNPKHDPAIDRVFIDANAHYFEQLIYSLGSDLDCVPPNPDRFHLRKLAHSYGLNEFVKRIDEESQKSDAHNSNELDGFISIMGDLKEIVEDLKIVADDLKKASTRFTSTPFDSASGSKLPVVKKTLLKNVLIKQFEQKKDQTTVEK